MTTPRYEIGQTVTFVRRGNTQTGRVVGHELVDDFRRRRGWHFFLRTAGGEILDLHDSQIGGLVGEVANVA